MTSPRPQRPPPSPATATPPAPLAIGAEVVGTDGPLGRLDRLVISPLNCGVTHVVVVDARHGDHGRLVPVGLVAADGPPLRLDCDLATFAALPPAEETEFVPADPSLGYGPYDLAWPYYGLTMVGTRSAPPRIATTVVYDRVPLGEVEVHRGDKVTATDGQVGAVAGLVVHPDDHQVTHVLLEEGHLWGRRQVAIPIRRVSAQDGLVVDLTLAEIRDLPAVGVDPFGPIGR